jgi:streptogramin lyase
MQRYGLLWRRLTAVVGLAFICLFVLLSFTGLPQVEAHPTRSVASTPGASYLYRFDPTSKSFFTISLSNGALPIGVAVTGTNPTHVWVAEYGLNRIRRVIFTGTANYAQAVYPIASSANSGPYRIAVRGNDVWFTERGANRVGRLNAATGQLDEFYEHGLSPNAGLSDIKVAPDGVVWMGGQFARRLIKLVVSLPGVYAFTEYTDTARPGFTVAPAFLAMANDLIWLTTPDSNYYKMATFTPSTQDFVWPVLPSGNLPRGIATVAGYAWYADESRNKIGQIEVGTYTSVNSFGVVTRPQEIAPASHNTFWLTLDDGRGAIARFVYTNAVSFQISTVALPTPGLRPAGIAVAPDGSVWVAAARAARLYLPLVRRDQ